MDPDGPLLAEGLRVRRYRPRHLARPVPLSPAVFRARAAGLLRELGGTEAVQLAAALVAYGRRQLEAERRA